MITEVQFLKSFNNPQEFELVVKDLYTILINFPQHSEKIVIYLLNNPEQFKRLIDGSWTLSCITDKCPAYAAPIIKSFINEYKTSPQVLSSLNIHFKQYPHTSKTLLQTILINPQFVQFLFKYFILRISDIRDMVVQYPSQAMLLIQTLCKHTEEFQRIVKNSDDLINLSKPLSEFADFLVKKDYRVQSDYVIHFVLNNPPEFNRLIVTERDSTKISRAFPRYAHVLEKSSAEETRMCLIKTKSSYEEIRKNATLLRQAERTGTGPSFFKDIPVELQEKIAAFTGNPEVHDEHESLKIAALSLR